VKVVSIILGDANKNFSYEREKNRLCDLIIWEEAGLKKVATQVASQ
jgi:hypothetical protein